MEIVINKKTTKQMETKPETTKGKKGIKDYVRLIVIAFLA